MFMSYIITISNIIIVVFSPIQLTQEWKSVQDINIVNIMNKKFEISK